MGESRCFLTREAGNFEICDDFSPSFELFLLSSPSSSILDEYLMVHYIINKSHRGLHITTLLVACSDYAIERC